MMHSIVMPYSSVLCMPTRIMLQGMFALFALSTPELPERKLTQRLPKQD